MRRGLLAGLSVAMLLTLVACGSGGGSSGAPVTSTTTAFPFDNAAWIKAGPNPSDSAKMVCSREAREDIEDSLGVKVRKVTKPTWVRKDHLYSCDYVFPRGKIRLDVKEMSSGDETTASFEKIKKQYGTVQELKGIGQGAWVLKNGDMLVRKDYKTLLVDVSGIPKDFVRAMRRSDVAINVANVIMSCWTGY